VVDLVGIGPLRRMGGGCRGRVGGRRLARAGDDLASAAGRFQRHPIEPPAHHPIRLGEEAVPADVDPVALIVDRLREAAQRVGFLQHDRTDAGSPEQFTSGGQSGGAGADDDGGFGVHVGYSAAFRVWASWG